MSGNTIDGSVSVSSNSGGVAFTDNAVYGSLAITNNTGGFTSSGTRSTVLSRSRATVSRRLCHRSGPG